MVVQIKNANHLKEQLVGAGDKLVVVDFFFPSMSEQRKPISDKFIEYAEEFPQVVFLKVDVDQCKEIAGDYAVTNMPTFIFIKNQKVIEGLSGADEKELKAAIAEHL